jgi:hypothetical protein
LSTAPMLLAVTPLPSPLTTPPLTTTYFIFMAVPRELDFWLCSNCVTGRGGRAGEPLLCSWASEGGESRSGEERG